MSSIIRAGDNFHGISVFGRGVFTHDDKHGRLTYAGQHRGGYACGLGVLTWSNGNKEYTEHGPDGNYDGRNLLCCTSGLTYYRLYERGRSKDFSRVSADGSCMYNFEACAPDDPRLLALIEMVAPVEVRPAAPAPHPPSPCHSPPINRPIRRLVLSPAGARDGRGHRGAPPRRTQSQCAMRHIPATAALQSTTTQRRVHGPI